ncbi:trypsin domain-containing protein [Phthorimaea operculella]|nr:trypsin domain-containing protein [Phthorimaea operculella]
MIKLLVVVSLLGVALGLPSNLLIDAETNPLVTRYYHETIGIEEAARIKATEEAVTFDGSRIVGGSAASLGQYPHLGGLVISLTNGRTSVCGSSLISNTKLVTAAHCWWDGQNQARQFTVVLGSLTLFSGGTRINTNNVVMHNNWNPNTIANDVAVITVPWVNFNNNIRNIGLASGNNQFNGQWAWATGFGAQRDGTSGIPTNQRLHHVQLQVITNAACRNFFGNNILASTLCTDGSARRSTCGGDSGGPLAIGNQLIGITSFGYRGGCEVGWPAAFARVSSFNSWISARL